MPKTSEKRRIVLLGPQGSGKGTQAELLSAHLGLSVIEMGKILRDEVRRGGPRAELLAPFLDAGKLAPHDITNDLLRERLAEPEFASGYITDGFPRATPQQDALDALAPPTHVIVLGISDDLAIERLAGRLTCACGKIYHEQWNPPARPGICNVCGGALARRSDDTPEAIRERLRIYHEETEPTLVRYEKRGILHRIDAAGTVPVVHALVLGALGITL